MTLEEKAHEYAINNVCKNCNDCQSKGYIGCDTFRFAKNAYIDCAKELKCCYNCKQSQDESYCKIKKSDVNDLSCWDCGCDEWESK